MIAVWKIWQLWKYNAKICKIQCSGRGNIHACNFRTWEGD